MVRPACWIRPRARKQRGSFVCDAYGIPLVVPSTCQFAVGSEAERSVSPGEAEKLIYEFGVATVPE